MRSNRAPSGKLPCVIRAAASAVPFAALLLALLAPRSAAADVLAGWDTSWILASTNNWGPSPFPATTSNSNLTVGGLTRGSGVGTGGSGANRAWGGNTWTSTSEGAAISAGQYGTFTVTANPGYTVSFGSIGTFSYRRSGTGATTGELQYQIGGGSFNDVAQVSYTSTSSGGASLAPIDLSGISALQNVAAGTTVTFRIVNWGGTGGTGTWYIFDTAATTANDFEIDGTVTQAVSATDIGVETAADGSGTIVPAQTIINNQSLTVYAVARGPGRTYYGNIPAIWSLASITGGVVAGDLVPSADGKSAVLTAHSDGSAVIHATSGSLTTTDSGVITTEGPQYQPSATGQAVPGAVANGDSVLLEVGVVPGASPPSTGISVTGDVSSLGGAASVVFHDDGANGDATAGDNIFSYQLAVGAGITGGSKTVPISVTDAQARSATTSISLRVLGELTIFHMNDTHARITPHDWVVPTHAPMSMGFEQVGGAATLAAAVLQSTAANPDTLVIDAGDMSEGNPLGDMGGNQSIEGFFELLSGKLLAQRGRGIDAVVVGNHDVRDIAYIQSLDALNASGTPVISVNVRDIATHTPHFSPYTIVTVNGIKIGILGYTTQAAAVGASLSSSLEVADCDWNSTDATKIHIASYVNELRNNQGCDMVVFAVHVGHSALATDTTIDGGSAPALLADDGSAKLPEIAITGHWHTWAETAWQPASLDYKTIFTEAGSYMHYLGELHTDGHGKYISSVSHVLRGADYTPDLDAQSYVDNLKTQYDASHPIAFDEVLGYTADDLLLDEKMKWWSSDEYPWSGNDTAGQWIADAEQWSCSQVFQTQCDLAFEVGGGVRSDIPAGPVTYAQAYETFPWSDDTVAKVNMTGQEIVNFLVTTNADAAFSRQLHVVAHDGVPTSVTINGAPIDLNHTYQVGITNYTYDNPPAGWSWSDPSPLRSNILERDEIVAYMQTFPIETPYTVGGARYELDTQFAGEYRGVVMMMNDDDTKPVYEDAFVRLLSATPETLERRGTKPVPTDLIDEQGVVNPLNRLAEIEVYRSYLGFKAGALQPGDIVEWRGKGGFYGGDPEFVDQEGIYADKTEFNIVGHDVSLAKPAFMPNISSFWDDNHKNHYVAFLARKVSANTAADQFGETIELMDATAYVAKSPVPGSTNDLLYITGIPTSENYGLRFRTNTVDLASSMGISDFPASSTVTAQIQPLAPEQTGAPLAVDATVSPDVPPVISVGPNADADVASGHATTNYGTATNLYIQSSSSGYGNERGWVRFDLSGLPSGTTITSATLQMYCWSASGPSLDAEVHGGTDDSWVETSITWNTQPAFGPTLSTTTLATGATDVWYNWDVTSFVQSKLAGDKLVSLLVKPAVESAATASAYAFDTKEYGSTAAVLRLTTQPPSTTVSQTQFYYRYSTDGTNWGAWTSFATDAGSPYNTTFSYPQGYGYYEFYSVATDSSGATQGAPPVAQAAVHYEQAPGYTSDAYVTLVNLVQTYDGSPKTAGVTTVPPGLTTDVTYDGGVTPPVHPGTYAVTATVTQSSYTGAASGTLTVGQASQSITFAALGTATLGTPPVTLGATASSGLPVSYISTNTAVATVSNNVLTIVGPGTTSIVASQSGNTDYLAATDVPQSLTVTTATAGVPALPMAALGLLALLLLAVARSALRPRR